VPPAESSVWAADRRDLQREHLRRIATALTRPSPGTPADAVALFREEAKLLSAQLRTAAKSGRRDEVTRATTMRTHSRRLEKQHKHGTLRFVFLVLLLVTVAVVVTVAMFETLYMVMG